jgi:hypothetical protein
MTELDFESAQLELLTEALRAGPGTPQWREALDTLQAVPGGADEYKLLCAARERLASGRSYREVRAGAGFTRKVFDSIEHDETAAGASPKALPSANLIAAVSAAAILGILAVVAYLIVPRSEEKPATEELARTYFVNIRAASNFDNDLGVEWSAFGPLAVQARSGLRPVLGALDPTTFRGGGITYQRTFDPDQPFAIEATLRLAKPSDDIVVQVFVADDRNFGQESATSPHELVWSLRGADASVVLPDGTVAAQAPKTRPGQATAELRLTINRSEAQIESNGRRIWTGKNQLDPAKPRLAGVRFLARGKVTDKDVPVVESVRVLVPQKQ